jgi:hypothetical protein
MAPSTPSNLSASKAVNEPIRAKPSLDKLELAHLGRQINEPNSSLSQA